MKYFHAFIFSMALSLLAGSIQAQDTTSLRFAAFSDGGELILFRDDSTNLMYAPFNSAASFNSLFHHPSTGELYCLHDSVMGAGRRDFYQIDPFSGAMTFVYSPAATYLAGACVGPNGIVYAITGNGGMGPGHIYAIDMFNGTESLFMSTDLTFGGGFQVGANITYYPPTNELWIFGGSVDSLIKINVNTQAETRVGAFLNTDGALKATYLDGNTFWLASDASYTFDAVAADSVRPSTFSLPDYLTDLELLDLVVGGDTIAICGSDSARLSSRFVFDDYRWYLNGSPLPGQSRTIHVTTPGTYRLLTQYDSNGGFYMWSETVEVVASVAPVADFGVAASGLVGVPVVFSDSSTNAQAYHWDFGDGSFSAASNPTHTYLSAGIYTVMLVVQNGPCTDTAYATVEILLVGMEDASNLGTISIAPNPATSQIVLGISSARLCEAKIDILDHMGAHVAAVYAGSLDAGYNRLEIDLSTGTGATLASGIYFLRVLSEEGMQTKRFIVRE